MKTCSLRGKNQRTDWRWFGGVDVACSETDDPWISAYGRTSSRGMKRQGNSLSFALRSFFTFFRKHRGKTYHDAVFCNIASLRTARKIDIFWCFKSHVYAYVCMHRKPDFYIRHRTLDATPEVNGTLRK